MEGFNRTDVGNAKRLVSLFGDRLRHVSEWGWLWYNGVRWLAVTDIFVHGLAKQTLAVMEVESQKLRASARKEDRDEGARLASWVFTCELGHHTELMVQKARDEVLASVDDFNRDPWLFNAQDVTVDLRTGETHEHDPKDMITKVAGTSYTEPSECVVFMAFLNDIFGGDQELIHYVQKVLGYSLVDIIREQHVWLSKGSGGNGKTMLFERTGDAMGDYATVGRTEMIIDQGKYQPKDFELVTLIGARRVTFSETKHGQKLNEERIKGLSGNGKATAEAKFKMPYKVQPHFKLFIDTNALPIVEDVGAALWRRLRVIPFNHCFIKNSTECQEPDTDLEEKLRAELPFVLRWLVAGTRMWDAEGLAEPKSVLIDTQTYKEDNDDLAEFLKDVTIKEPEAKTKLKDLYTSYANWYEGDRWEVPDSKVFGKQLTAHGYISKKSHGVMVYQGIRLKTGEEMRVNQGTAVLARAFHQDAFDATTPDTDEDID